MIDGARKLKLCVRKITRKINEQIKAKKATQIESPFFILSVRFNNLAGETENID